MVFDNLKESFGPKRGNPEVEPAEYPPGVESRGRELNTNPVFLPVGRVESGGSEFNTQWADGIWPRAGAEQLFIHTGAIRDAGTP